MSKRIIIFPACWIIAIAVFTLHIGASPYITYEVSSDNCDVGGVITTQDFGCDFVIVVANGENDGNDPAELLIDFETRWEKPPYIDDSEVNKGPAHPPGNAKKPVEIHDIEVDSPELLGKNPFTFNSLLVGDSHDITVTIPTPEDGGKIDETKLADDPERYIPGNCSRKYGTFEGKYPNDETYGTYIYCWQQEIYVVIKDRNIPGFEIKKRLITIKDNQNGPYGRLYWEAQQKGTGNVVSSTDSSNRQEDVGNKPTQTTPPANDSDKIAALQQNIVDLQADVVSLNELVDKLLKENAALRHDNAVLSTLIDANQSNIIVVDEVVSEEATEVSQGTTETVSAPQVETSVTATVDISGYEFVDIAPDGRPRIISTVDVQIHPDTRKRFLSEWGKFYDEHRDIEWWDCAGWSPYESPPVAVPVSEINANPHNHCDLRKP